MEWVETTGRTVAEALDRALDQLGVDEQEAEYDVVDEPQKGLFGRLRVEARVRARVRPAVPRPKAERRDRRRGRGEGGRDRDRDRRGRGGSGKGRGSGSGSSGSSGGGGSAAGSRNGDGRGGGAAEVAGVGAAVTGGDQTVATGAASRSEAPATSGSDGGSDDGSGNGNARKRRRRRRGGSANTQGAVVANTNQASTDELRPALDLDEQRAAVEEFLTGLVAAFGRPEATVSVDAADEEENTLEAEVHGEELGLLVGPKGATLQAVHELVRSMVQRRFVGEAHARVRVDVAGYRQRRREALERFTHTVADEVLSSGRAKVLDPMMASDRKVVHDVANEIEGVRTVSEGEEPSRRVIIQPA